MRSALLRYKLLEFFSSLLVRPQYAVRRILARSGRCPDSLPAQSVRGQLFDIFGDYILVVVAHS